jgi:hypothetical protein
VHDREHGRRSNNNYRKKHEQRKGHAPSRNLCRGGDNRSIRARRRAPWARMTLTAINATPTASAAAKPRKATSQTFQSPHKERSVIGVPPTGSPGPFPSGLPGHRIMQESSRQKAGALESTRHPRPPVRRQCVPGQNSPWPGAYAGAACNATGQRRAHCL